MPGILAKNKAESYVRRFSSTRAVVLGDVMIDRYFWGAVDRISPEAPVPVVKVSRKSTRPGGAANVALNLRDLGADVLLIGVIGDDRGGSELINLLQSREIPSSALKVDPGRPTTEKVRIIAQSQQIARTDFEKDLPVGEEIWNEFLDLLIKTSRERDILIVSDYGKGVIERRYLQEAISVWRAEGKQVLIDPHIGHFDWYKNASLMTPNFKEACSFFAPAPAHELGLDQMGGEIVRALNLDAVLITRGEAGMNLYTGDGRSLYAPAAAKEVYDVTGAGDTVISVLAAGLGSGVDVEDCVVLANQAAGEVVKEIGTSSLTGEMLINALL